MDDTTKQLVLDYQRVFATDAGRRVYDDLRTRSNYTSLFTNFVGFVPPEKVTFELGKREMFLYILDKMKADPDAVVQKETEEE